MALLVLLSRISLSFSILSLPLHSKSLTLPPKSISLSSDALSFDLHSIYTSQYYLSLYLGSPEREVYLAIDTTSSWTWIPSADCDCHASIGFNPSESSSYLSLDSNAEVNYAYGYVQGTVSQETFRTTAEDAVRFNSSFILVQQEEDFWWLACDGLLGLGFSNSTSGYFGVVDRLKMEGVVEDRVFSLFISKNEEEMRSEVSIGGSDPEKYSSKEGNEIRIEESGSWLCIVDGIHSNHIDLNYTGEGIFNPGLGFIIGPQPHVEIIFEEIMAVADCVLENSTFLVCLKEFSNITAFPVVKFEISNNTYSVHPETYTYVSDNEIYILILSHDYSYWVLGQPLFKEYYSVFDMEHMSLVLYKTTFIEDPSILIYIIVVVLVIIIIVVPVLVYYVISKRKAQQIAQADVTIDDLGELLLVNKPSN